MSLNSRGLKALLIASACFIPAAAMAETPWTVKPEWVSAHESFLASSALQGRGSATRDEAIAAAYVASQFEGYGLKPAPGMTGYTQVATIIKPRLDGHASLIAGNTTTAEGSGLTLLMSPGQSVSGVVTLAADDPGSLTAGSLVIAPATSKTPANQWLRMASRKGVKLLILRESDDSKKLFALMGNATSMGIYLEGQAPNRPRPNVVVLSGEAFDKLTSGTTVSLKLGPVIEDKMTTTNAIGYLQGSDPKAGVILLSAHLDHLGVKPDGTIMPGANDDASGTTAVLELAHAMSASQTPRRSILFVAYGSEEIGGFGSQYFGAHSPVPLTDIATNIEFEMIGAQDPKMPEGIMMMTGSERSDLFENLKAHGALIAADPYPDQNFFERSDNYSLAKVGIVAHTISGWAVTPTYHSPTDDLAHLNLPYMVKAIQSLIEPVRWLADGNFQPQWKPGGKP